MENQRLQPHWDVIATIKTKNGELIDLEYKKKESNFNTKEEATKFLKELLKKKIIKNKSVKTRRKIIQKPKPMNTVDLLSTASDRLGLDVQDIKS